MISVLVLSGGVSDERTISIRSGEAVTAALKQAGYMVHHYDPADGNAGLLVVAQSVDVVFPVLHGVGGEDGTIQRLLENHSIPFVGTGGKASQLCFDKWRYKQFLHAKSFPTPPGALVDVHEFKTSEITNEPFVMKPHDGGSSIDTYLVRNPSNADDPTLHTAFNRHSHMLIERLVTGSEITVGVLEDTALPVIEIVPPENQEFDYENKYNGKTLELCPPRTIQTHVQHAAQQLALAIHAATGCKGFSRTDIIVDDEERLWVLETNTIPGLTEQSLYPRSAHVAGYTMPTLVDTLIKQALR